MICDDTDAGHSDAKADGEDESSANALHPVNAGAVGAGDEQPVQRCDEDSALDGKAELAALEKIVRKRGAVALLPVMG